MANHTVQTIDPAGALALVNERAAAATAADASGDVDALARHTRELCEAESALLFHRLLAKLYGEDQAA